MAFNYQVILQDPNGYAAGMDLVGATSQALADWSTHLDGTGLLDVAVIVRPAGAGRADASSTANIQVGTTASGATLVENGSIYALATGQHVAGTTSDITINVDPGYLAELHFGGGVPPADQADAVSVFRHELAHAFGFSGYLEQDGQAAYGGRFATAFDTFIDRHADGTAFFTGPAAEAVYGGPVPLTASSSTENFYHLGSSGADPLATDLMNGIAFGGRTYAISSLDLAILQDVGAPVVDPAGAAPAARAVSVVASTSATDTPADWTAIGAAMTHYNAATGQWWNGSYETLLAWASGQAGTGDGQQPAASHAVPESAEASPGTDGVPMDWASFAAQIQPHNADPGLWA